MKKINVLIICFSLFATIAIAQNKGELTDPKALPQFSWKSTEVIDMGKIEKDSPATATFEFKNTGKAPLIISNAKGSCGCTGVEYPKQAIVPGETGYVKVTYNAASEGHFNKTVTLTTNASEETVVLQIKGEVHQLLSSK